MENGKRLIDANAVDYENIMCSQSQLHWINAIIEKQPTLDAVEVVRCKDCKYGEPMVGSWDKKVWCGYHQCFFLEDGFCSYGEKR